MALKDWDKRNARDGILFVNKKNGNTVEVFFSRVPRLKNRYRVHISKKKSKSFKTSREAMLYAVSYMRKH